jgi:hypothetical protein
MIKTDEVSEQSWLTQRAYVASGRSEVMHTDVRRTDVTDVLRRLSAETWDLNTIFRVEALQHFGDEESPLWKQFRERLDLEMPIGGGRERLGNVPVYPPAE